MKISAAKREHFVEIEVIQILRKQFGVIGIISISFCAFVRKKRE